MHTVHLSDQKRWSQDPPLPRPHLRVGSGGKGILLENPAYPSSSKGRQLPSFVSVFVAIAFDQILAHCSLGSCCSAVSIVLSIMLQSRSPESCYSHSKGKELSELAKKHLCNGSTKVMCSYLKKGEVNQTWHNGGQEIKESVSQSSCTLVFPFKLTHHALASLWFPDVFLLFLEFSLGVEITERKLAAEGSSVMMHAPAVSNMSITEWEYIEDRTPKFILQYYANLKVPIIYAAYQGRVVFYKKNGSLLLQQLREADSGIYKATVDLMQDRTRTTILEVISKSKQVDRMFCSDKDLPRE